MPNFIIQKVSVALAGLALLATGCKFFTSTQSKNRSLITTSGTEKLLLLPYDKNRNDPQALLGSSAAPADDAQAANPEPTTIQTETPPTEPTTATEPASLAETNPASESMSTAQCWYLVKLADKDTILNLERPIEQAELFKRSTLLTDNFVPVETLLFEMKQNSTLKHMSANYEGVRQQLSEKSTQMLDSLQSNPAFAFLSGAGLAGALENFDDKNWDKWKETAKKAAAEGKKLDARAQVEQYKRLTLVLSKAIQKGNTKVISRVLGLALANVVRTRVPVVIGASMLAQLSRPLLSLGQTAFNMCFRTGSDAVRTGIGTLCGTAAVGPLLTGMKFIVEKWTGHTSPPPELGKASSEILSAFGTEMSDISKKVEVKEHEFKALAGDSKAADQTWHAGLLKQVGARHGTKCSPGWLVSLQILKDNGLIDEAGVKIEIEKAQKAK